MSHYRDVEGPEFEGSDPFKDPNWKGPRMSSEKPKKESLEDENTRLRAELAALKPKPVVIKEIH